MNLYNYMSAQQSYNVQSTKCMYIYIVILFFALQLTPLAELSIPRRSTTAPAGPRGGAGALMSPHQFAHSTTATTTPPVGNSDVTAVVPEKSKVKRKGAEPVGLTRQQLQRALLYLIKVS